MISLFYTIHEFYGSSQEYWRKKLEKIDGRKINGLIRTLKQNKDPLAREKAAKALGYFNDDKSLQALFTGLYDQDPDVCRAAANALGDRRDIRAVEPLLSALKMAIEDDSEMYQPDDFALALASIGEPKAIFPLISALTSKKPWHQKPIRDALIQFGYIAADSLIAALQDENPQIRNGVLPILSALGPQVPTRCATS